MTLSVIELSDLLQLYSGNSSRQLIYYQGQIGLKPAHPNGWYVILDIVLIASFLQSLCSILACTSAFKFRNSMPDLITDGLIIHKFENNEDDDKSIDYGNEYNISYLSNRILEKDIYKGYAPSC